MGTSATSVSSLERNEEAGTAKTGTIARALKAMGKSSVTFVLDEAHVQKVGAIKAQARRIADKTALTMRMEGQGVTPQDTESIYESLVADELAKL